MDAFLSIFGPRSGGLSLFVNNPFHRKKDSHVEPLPHAPPDCSKHRRREREAPKDSDRGDASQETQASGKRKKAEEKKRGCHSRGAEPGAKPDEKRKRKEEDGCAPVMAPCKEGLIVEQDLHLDGEGEPFQDALKNQGLSLARRAAKRRETPQGGERKDEEGSASEKGRRKRDVILEPELHVDGEGEPTEEAVKNHGVICARRRAAKRKDAHKDESLQVAKQPNTLKKEKLEAGRGPANPGSKRKHAELVEERYEKRRRVTSMAEKLAGLELKENGGAEHGQRAGGGEKSESRKRKREEEKAEDAAKKRIAFDGEERLRRTIFVGNLPLNTRKKDIIKELSAYGAVESARFRSVPLKETKLSRRGAIINGQVNEAINSMHAYVVFKEEDCATAALAYNMKEFLGNHIRVDMAHAPCKVSKDMLSIYDRTRSIFIGNVPFDVKDEELYQLFGVGKDCDMDVEAVRVVRDPQSSLCKGIAFILFKSKVGAKHALSRESVTLRGRELRVFRVRASQYQETSRPRPRKRKDENMVDTGQRKRMKVRPAYQGICASKPGDHQSRWTASDFKTRNLQKRIHRENMDARPLKRKTPAVAVRKFRDSRSAGVAVQLGEKRKRVEKHQRGSSRAKKIRRH